MILSEANRMHRMVQDLLVLARLDAGTADLRREEVPLPGLLNGVVTRFNPQAAQAKVALRGEIPEVLPLILGDGDRLAQVFGNLVDNALKFTRAGGSVTLQARQAASQVEVIVSDSGVGISPDDQGRIFERFYQTDKSRQRDSGRGVGLGLSIALQIVQAHGGSLTVDSLPGRGSNFIVRLPVEQGRAR